jgi:hypothetical protein
VYLIHYNSNITYYSTTLCVVWCPVHTGLERIFQPTHMEQCNIKSKIYNYFDIVHSVQYNIICKYTALLTHYRQVKGNKFITYLVWKFTTQIVFCYIQDAQSRLKMYYSFLCTPDKTYSLHTMRLSMNQFC